jgi:RNA polymerase sigma-B factor
VSGRSASASPARRKLSRSGCEAAARDRALFRRYRDGGDPNGREVLVRRFLPLARHLAARYARGEEPYDDLLQVACLALLRAIDRFDPARGAAFSTFAVPTIRGELKRHYRDKTWAVRVPRGLQDLAVAVTSARERLTVDLGRPATVGELAEHMGICECAVLEALRAGDAHSAASLDVASGREGSGVPLRDTLAYHEHGYDLADERASLDDLLDTLSRREREIVRLRFEEDLTQRQIGRRVGISQMQVSRILRNAIAALAATAESERAHATAPLSPVAAAH